MARIIVPVGVVGIVAVQRATRAPPPSALKRALAIPSRDRKPCSASSRAGSRRGKQSVAPGWPKRGIGHMLGFMFGFNARLGRLHYFLSMIGARRHRALVLCFRAHRPRAATCQRARGHRLRTLNNGAADRRSRIVLILVEPHAAIACGFATSDGIRSASSRPGSRSWSSTSRSRTKFPALVARTTEHYRHRGRRACSISR